MDPGTVEAKMDVFLRAGLLPRWAAGTRVPAGGDYVLVAKLGEGGFGEVWSARGPEDFPVAIKFVSLTSGVGQLELEALRILRQVRHANLIAVHGAFLLIDGDRCPPDRESRADTLAVVMEQADGSLRKRWEAR